MVMEIVIGIIEVAIGICVFLGGLNEEETKIKVVGGVIVVLGILLILDGIKTDNYTEWKATSETEIILQAENDQYVIENEKEYLYEVLTYTENGEKTEECKSIEKNQDTFVEYVEIGQDEIACCSKFTRENKSVLGANNGFIQTKYVFYIPTN